MKAYPMTTEDLHWTLSYLCELHGIPFDDLLVSQQYPPPHDSRTLYKAARALGFRVGIRTPKARRVPSLPLPCIALLSAGADDEYAGDLHTPALILRADEERVLLFTREHPNGLTLGIDDFEGYYAGQVILVKAAPSENLDQEEILRPRQFGLSWFIPEMLKYRHIWRDILLASLAIQVIGMATPLFTQTIIDKVIVHQTVNTLVVIAGGMLVFNVFNAVLSWLRQYLVIHTGNRIDSVLASTVLEHLLKLPARYYQHRPTGVLVARLRGVETIREFLTGAAMAGMLDLPFLFIYLAIMFYYSVTLSLITLVILALMIALSLAVTPVFRQRVNQQFLLGARNQAFLTEYLSGMETVKSLQMEPQLKERYGEYLATYLQASFNTRQISNTYNSLANLLAQLMSVAIMGFGAWTVIHDQEFSIGMLIAFQMFAGRLTSPMLKIAGLWQDFQQASIAVKRLGDILNSPTEPWSLKPTRDNRGSGRIDIRGLSFRHAPDLPFLYRDLNLSIEAGKCMAIMGPSGCGKSTFAKLLLGFYQPTEGEILIDGKDLRYLSANELRLNFGVVPQETNLFSGTLYDNLILANPHASFEQIVAACRQAEIHDVIEQLPQGYQTEVGERGVGLSGGQKQRLAIARALLKGAPILIFDEATSNLDPVTAEQFARTVNQLRGQVTMLFITHQLPASLVVDDVIRLGPEARRQAGSPVA